MGHTGISLACESNQFLWLLFHPRKPEICLLTQARISFAAVMDDSLLITFKNAVY